MAPSAAHRGETGVRAQIPSGLYREPLSGTVISVVLTLVSLTILSVFLTQRYLPIRAWSRLPYILWLAFAIYVDSFVFVFATAILQYGFGVGSSFAICEAAILLCLACYVTTKFIYLFLVEKVFVIRVGKRRRMRSKLYLFNSFGMIGAYVIIVVLNFVFRFTRMDNGQCIIGMKRLAMIPLISFDTLVNVYLTILFLIPLSGLYSFKHPRTPANLSLRRIALRTFIGALCTLASSIVNLTVLMALDGEPGWVCLMCCNSDILFSAIVIQWIISKDHAATGSPSDRSQSGHITTSSSGVTRTANSTSNARPRPMSPLTVPSAKPAIEEDVAEIGLDSYDRPRPAGAVRGLVGPGPKRHGDGDGDGEQSGPEHERPKPTYQPLASHPVRPETRRGSYCERGGGPCSPGGGHAHGGRYCRGSLDGVGPAGRDRSGYGYLGPRPGRWSRGGPFLPTLKE